MNDKRATQSKYVLSFLNKNGTKDKETLVNLIHPGRYLFVLLFLTAVVTFGTSKDCQVRIGRPKEIADMKIHADIKSSNDQVIGIFIIFLLL
jgi:hypothetical protein